LQPVVATTASAISQAYLMRPSPLCLWLVTQASVSRRQCRPGAEALWMVRDLWARIKHN
jgi:hypothetical protein